MTNKEKMIKGMKLLKEGCKNILPCNAIDCPLYHFCYDEIDGMSTPPCNWTIDEEE